MTRTSVFTGAPRAVIVGRPNVGESSLFNWLARKRLAIVDSTAGVTRDRMTYPTPADSGLPSVLGAVLPSRH